MISFTNDVRNEVPPADPAPSPKERRLERLRAWRAANREHLRDYADASMTASS